MSHKSHTFPQTSHNSLSQCPTSHIHFTNVPQFSLILFHKYATTQSHECHKYISQMSHESYTYTSQSHQCPTNHIHFTNVPKVIYSSISRMSHKSCTFHKYPISQSPTVSQVMYISVSQMSHKSYTFSQMSGKSYTSHTSVTQISHKSYT